jgi:hypothetical protein
MTHYATQSGAALPAQHTQEPIGLKGLRSHNWTVDTDGENSVQFIGPKGKLPICAVVVNSAFGKDHILDANTARLAAAWNACTGIPTEALEAGVVADMRSALENLIIAIGMGWDLDGVLEVAEAALAKLEGRT